MSRAMLHRLWRACRGLAWTWYAMGLMVVWSLSACDRGASGPEAWFPLAEGRSWTYAVRTEPEGDVDKPAQTTLTLSNLGPHQVEGLDGGPAFKRRSSEGMDYFLRQDGSGTYRVGSRSELRDTITLDASPRPVLKWPLQVGSTWQASTTAYLLKRRAEFPREVRHSHPEIPMTYTVETLEASVQTPAGRFSPCVQVRGEAKLRLFVDPVQGWRDVPLTTQEWYCQNVGLVKLTREERAGSGFLTGGLITMELNEWQ